jgi:hypothetical protein
MVPSDFMANDRCLKQTFHEMFVLEGAKGCQKYRPILCDRIRWSNQLRRDTLYTDSEAGRNTLLRRRRQPTASAGRGAAVGCPIAAATTKANTASTTTYERRMESAFYVVSASNIITSRIQSVPLQP